MTIRHELHEQIAHTCITALARKYITKLSSQSLYEYEDLVQEGWIIYWKVMTTKRIRWEGNQFPALIKLAVERRFKNLVRDSFWPHTHRVVFDTSTVDGTIDQDTNPERLAMLSEALEAVCAISPELASYLVQGGSLADFGFIRYLQRERKRKNWTLTNMHFRWTPELVQLIFNFDAASISLRGYI